MNIQILSDERGDYLSGRHWSLQSKALQAIGHLFLWGIEKVACDDDGQRKDEWIALFPRWLSLADRPIEWLVPGLRLELNVVVVVLNSSQ